MASGAPGSQNATEQKTRAPMSHTKMNKTECIQELGQKPDDLPEIQGIQIHLSQLSVQELRSMVQSQRERSGRMNPRPIKDAFLKQIGRDVLPELRKKCEDRGIEMGPEPRVADLRLKLRQWYANEGPGAASSSDPSPAELQPNVEPQDDEARNYGFEVVSASAPAQVFEQ
ncbi:unnamed protein product [Durusdinium trenchii]|uniref:Uncharacterized protein n=1 Tax=Durusdinium trenchii TaxID=1381693 RepID=A0ABP0HI22_9DINO